MFVALKLDIFGFYENGNPTYFPMSLANPINIACPYPSIKQLLPNRKSPTSKEAELQQTNSFYKISNVHKNAIYFTTGMVLNKRMLFTSA